MPYEDTLISVVVPVYKTEKFISACIDSILCQTHKNFQLILVDDGSPDRSGAICDEYAARDDRILVKHTVNQGVSAARNDALELVRGEYISFIDSDDYIDEDFFAEALREIETSKADIYIGGQYYEYFSEGVLVRTENKNGLDKVYDIPDLLDNFEVEYPFYLICDIIGKLYRTDVIRKHRLLFDPQVSLGEDMLFNCDYLEHSEHAIFSSKLKYHYARVNNESLFSKFRPDLYDISIPLYDRMLSLLKTMGCGEQAINRMIGIYVRVLIGCIYNQFEFYDKSSPQSRLELIRKVSRNPIVQAYPLKNYHNIKAVGLLLLLKLGRINLINWMFTRHYGKNK